MRKMLILFHNRTYLFAINTHKNQREITNDI